MDHEAALKSVTALCRESGVSESTFYRWRARHPAKNGASRM
ncbi:transposase [Sorangium sp. So ce118]